MGDLRIPLPNYERRRGRGSRTRRRTTTGCTVLLLLLLLSSVSAFQRTTRPRLAQRPSYLIPLQRKMPIGGTTTSSTELASMMLLPDVTIFQSAATHAMHSASHFLALSNFDNVLPFSEMGRQLSQSLSIGSNLSRNVGQIPETTTSLVLESMGYDLLVFLAASVFVTPVCKSLKITPILGYLIIGAILGPHGLDVFANSKADIELGDFGILFLLFSEGLDVSTQRLQKLTNFLPLGLAQISLCTAVISAAFALGMPQWIGQSGVPITPSLLEISKPAEVLVLAFAGALSTSAFVFPVLKDFGWEDEESGEAATSILLLQDLLVAPLLVLLPFLVGENETDYAAIGFLTAKATLGFGGIMYGASFVLRRLFVLVAQTQSTETFVALCLLVAAGMGSIAKFFGLTDTAGAFAAGVVSIAVSTTYNTCGGVCREIDGCLNIQRMGKLTLFSFLQS